ncbi:MAG: response regulator, partial [Gammaproteobacteria bacterium]|nr:response regulator [Gammaproteobacteria bacterium]
MSKILIVDDDAVNRMILQGMLLNAGHEVVEAENGQIALDMFISEKPGIVLMDIMMPVMAGYEATQKIKELAGESFVPVIVLTAMTDEDELVKCVNSGADDFLTKPFSHVVLMAKIKALVRMQDLYNTISH